MEVRLQPSHSVLCRWRHFQCKLQLLPGEKIERTACCGDQMLVPIGQRVNFTSLHLVCLVIVMFNYQKLLLLQSKKLVHQEVITYALHEVSAEQKWIVWLQPKYFFSRGKTLPMMKGTKRSTVLNKRHAKKTGKLYAETSGIFATTTASTKEKRTNFGQTTRFWHVDCKVITNGLAG